MDETGGRSAAVGSGMVRLLAGALMLTLSACGSGSMTAIEDGPGPGSEGEGGGSPCTVPCGAGEACEDGRCLPPADPSSFGAVDGGGDGCGLVQVGARRFVPKVMVIVDQSGSMLESFPVPGGAPTSRWDAVRDALIGREGIVTELDGVVEFGLSLYTAVETDAMPNVPKPGTECPMVHGVPVAPGNRSAIASLYETQHPRDETPTGDSVMKILEDYRAVPDPDPDPTLFILATDGLPDRCEQLNNKGVPEAQAEINDRIARDESIAALTEARRFGIQTYVLAVGEETVAIDHLQELANAGVGRNAAEPDAPYWEAGNQAGLSDALREIVGSALSCEVALAEKVDVGNGCSGTVRLNGNELTCDDPNGYRIVDSRTLLLEGEACERLKSANGATLEAEFPCDVILF